MLNNIVWYIGIIAIALWVIAHPATVAGFVGVMLGILAAIVGFLVSFIGSLLA